MALFCSQCGAENHPDAVTCYNCQSPMARPVDHDRGQYGTPHDYGDTESNNLGYDEADGGKKASGLSRLGSIFVGVVCVIYLLNPTAGVDLIPDFIPVVGNLDEAGAVAALLVALSNLGIIPYRRT